MENPDLLANLTAWATDLLPYAYVFVGLIVLDLIGGVAIALKQKRFKLEAVGEFAINAGLYLLGWVMAEAVSFLPEFFGVQIQGFGELVAQGFGTVVYASIVLKYTASILGHITAIREIGIVNRLGVPPTGK